MSDLTIPIIGLTTLAGYFFSKDGKAPRKEESKREKIEQFEKPNSKNIYNSNKYEEVNVEMLQRSLKNYKDAENPAMTGVLPPLFNTYSIVGSEGLGVVQNTMDEKEITRVNKVVDVTQLGKNASIDINKRPMFSEERTLDTTYEIQKEVNREVSLLTGLPIDKTHTNMTPFFGSNVRQNVENFTNEPLLDRHTGNASLFQHKKEVESMFKEMPQDIYGTPIFTDSVNTDRYVPSLYRQNEKVIQDKKFAAPIAGTFENTIRPSFKDVNELRVGNRLKETYEARLKAGQLGSVRGIQSKVEKQRPDTFYEKNMDHLFKTPGQYLADKAPENYEMNFKNTNRKNYNLEYYGNVSAGDKTQNKQRMATTENDKDAYFQPPKRNNFDNDYLRNVSGTKSTIDYGKSAITSYETERASTSEKTHLLNASKTELGTKTRFEDAPKTTIKETTLSFDNSGNVKTSFNKGIKTAFDMGISNVSAKTTHKESTLINNYKGVADKNSGLGYIVNKYDARTTGKEIISSNSDYQGAPNLNFQNMQRSNYDNADIRGTKETIISGSRAPGPQNFQIAAGKLAHGEVNTSQNLLLKECNDNRDKMNVHQQQVIPSKELIGYKTKVKLDEDKLKIVDRFDPSIVNSQLNQNPYSIYGKSKK
jgi:hypothetical protein